jgi:hypothetical protein
MIRAASTICCVSCEDWSWVWLMLPVMSLELLLVVFKFVRIFSVKLGCTVLSINAIPFFQKKKKCAWPIVDW